MHTPGGHSGDTIPLQNAALAGRCTLSCSDNSPVVSATN
jgi:hypothetical protein